MKILKIFTLSLGIASVASLFLSCKRDIPQVAPLDTAVNTSATIQVFSATVKASRNYVYVDGIPVSGAAVAYGGVFPGTAYAFKVASGSHTILIKDTLSTTTQTPLSFSQTLDIGKSYTIFTYDTTTSVKQATVVNDIVVPSDTSSRLRFANFIYNTTAVANVDVYSLKRIAGTPVYTNTAVLNGTPVLAPTFTGSTPVFSNIATAQVSPFVPYSSGITDTLYVFATGTTSPLLAKGAINSLIQTRSYTSTYNGSYKGALATRLVNTFATY